MDLPGEEAAAALPTWGRRAPVAKRDRGSIDAANRVVSGSVTSGNFCGYIGTADRRSYYTLYFVAHFDAPFLNTGTWQNSAIRPNTTEAAGGTTYGSRGFVPPGKGSGGWVVLDTSKSANVGVRVGISYVSQANAEANLRAENPTGSTFDTVRKKAHAAWNEALNKIQIEGGTHDEQVVFYTALYHTLMGENLYSDVDGSYMGMDGKVHRNRSPEGTVQYVLRLGCIPITVTITYTARTWHRR
jgi:putative alpha-1,2-mannosidase